jgi:ribonuclease R
MKEHLGEEFGGVVTAATGFGLFVQLDAMYVEGLVHITELGGEYFKFDEARQELRGERTGIRYAIGTRVRVQVSRVDLDGRKIDFRLVKPGEEVAAVQAFKLKGQDNDRWASPAVGKPKKASAKKSGRESHGRGAAVPVSPIQAIRAAAKKAAKKTGAPRKKGKRG